MDRKSDARPATAPAQGQHPIIKDAKFTHEFCDSVISPRARSPETGMPLPL
ncbi:MAG: hypothetical protein U0X75_08120 [Acidobacteriota bacterium]